MDSELETGRTNAQLETLLGELQGILRGATTHPELVPVTSRAVITKTISALIAMDQELCWHKRRVQEQSATIKRLTHGRSWTGFHPKQIQQVVGKVNRFDFMVRDAVTREVRIMTPEEWDEAMRVEPEPVSEIDVLRDRIAALEAQMAPRALAEALLEGVRR